MTFFFNDSKIGFLNFQVSERTVTFVFCCNLSREVNDPLNFLHPSFLYPRKRKGAGRALRNNTKNTES